MFTFYGQQDNIHKNIVGIATRSFSLKKSDKIFIADKNNTPMHGYLAIIQNEHNSKHAKVPVLYVSEDTLEYINDGDLLNISPEGRLEILYKREDKDHTVFMTNMCNSRCIMCPQAFEKDDPELLQRAIYTINAIPPHSLKRIGITGGEPTLYLSELCRILNISQRKHFSATVSLLTNGRVLSNFLTAKQLSLQNQHILFCIPLYGATDDQHDSLVGIKGAFSETISGIHNLYRLGQNVEIRIVLIKQSITNLMLLSSFIFRNFPFVTHVAFMGAEYVGQASKNLDFLWIEPLEYMSELEKSLWYLHQRGINVSIYNLPLCLLPEKLKPFACDSISQWKKVFLPTCTACSQKDCCAGIFSTSERQSDFIHPI